MRVELPLAEGRKVLVNLLNNAQQAVAEQPKERKLVVIRGWCEEGAVRQRTDLGLSIAQQIVDLHQGKLEASSYLGEGTRLLLRLPGGV